MVVGLPLAEVLAPVAPLMSWPAKCLPFGERTITLTWPSTSAARHAWSGSSGQRRSWALAASGRFRVMTAIRRHDLVLHVIQLHRVPFWWPAWRPLGGGSQVGAGVRRLRIMPSCT